MHTRNQAFRRSRSGNRCQTGLSLIEVIVFIVIVSIAVVSILGVFAGTLRNSADPMIERQAQAIAESLLEEVLAMPFTYCDPDDANAATAASPAGCAAAAETMGPEAGETRGNPVNPFDNVNDYNGYAMAGGITDITGSPIAGLVAYGASVAIAPLAFAGIPNTDVLLVTVTVTGPGNLNIRMDGIRTRYAPNI